MLAIGSPKPIVVGTGPAGSGKTILACQVALDHVAKLQRPKIVLTRPIVAADEDMGYLPGDIDQKMEPWTKPMYDIFEQFFTYTQMDRFITVEPLGYMRGRTFNDTLIIADEMQNATPNQMKMLLTRVGEGTKLIITGDLEQSDLGPENGLQDLIYKMQCQDLEYITHVGMGDEDIVRHPVVKEVLRLLSK
jgi:phosphate starvation-inducible PhoH-like protein